jgi:hypothetical protein
LVSLLNPATGLIVLGLAAIALALFALAVIANGILQVLHTERHLS